MKGWDMKHIQSLKEQGRIVDYKIICTKKPENNSHNLPKNIPKRNKTKEWIALNLSAWCKVNGFELIPEYRFCDRKWRFDWCVLKDGKPFIAWEYEGGIFMEKSGHNTAKHYNKDANKYNMAASLGWKIYRYTVLNYRSITDDLKNIIL